MALPTFRATAIMYSWRSPRREPGFMILSTAARRTTAAKNPRTVCGCQPVEVIIVAMVAPPSRLSSLSTRACFEPAQASLLRSWRFPHAAAQTRIISVPEFCWFPGNPCELSKGYFATTFLSSSLTCPATHSGLCGLCQICKDRCDIPFAVDCRGFNGQTSQ